ncbi:hypothetical protein [Thermococcus kodakarensis]|nr:hypothetical protein [Thermococcus kodakarensis]WCN28512.1 hypothetical protein POG15_02270 [Thermococcus kodakarensis]WCN30808.1 hypothetical protein POG21_02270 [Thermococcus kodakarensis]
MIILKPEEQKLMVRVGSAFEEGIKIRKNKESTSINSIKFE